MSRVEYLEATELIFQIIPIYDTTTHLLTTHNDLSLIIIT
jgi:hypothetical protein